MRKHQLNWKMRYSPEEQMDNVLPQLLTTSKLRVHIFQVVYMEVVSRIDFAYLIEKILVKEDGE